MEEARRAQMEEGFVYVSFDELSAAGDATAKHRVLFVVFLPANATDHLLLGTPMALGHAPVFEPGP